MLIRLGHSPDPDDAFMFWALAREPSIAAASSSSTCSRDIQTLNEWSLDGRLEVTAISLRTYPFVQERYALLPHGASFGSGYGPIVVAREPLSLDELRDDRDRRPGQADDRLPRPPAGARRRLRLPRACRSTRSSTRSRPGTVARRPAHPRGPAHVRRRASQKCLDLGEWWLLETGLPLPLGVNVDPPRPRRGDAHELSAILPSRSTPRSRTARRRWSTRSSSAAGSTTCAATASSGCT